MTLYKFLILGEPQFLRMKTAVTPGSLCSILVAMRNSKWGALVLNCQSLDFTKIFQCPHL